MDFPKPIHQHVLQLIFLLELIFLITNTLKCYRIGTRVGDLHNQFAERIIDRDTFQRLYEQEIDKSLIIKAVIMMTTRLGFTKYEKEIVEAEGGVVYEKHAVEEKSQFFGRLLGRLFDRWGCQGWVCCGFGMVVSHRMFDNSHVLLLKHVSVTGTVQTPERQFFLDHACLSDSYYPCPTGIGSFPISHSTPKKEPPISERNQNLGP